MVSPDGSVRLLFLSTGTQYVGTLDDSQDRLDGDLTAIAASGRTLAGGSSVGSVTISGDVQGERIEGQYSGADGSGTFTLLVQSDYAGAPSAEVLNGEWSASAPGAPSAANAAASAVGIVFQGQSLEGGDTLGCDYRGSVGGAAGDFQAFQVSIEVSGCPALSGTYGGLAILNDFAPGNATLTVAATLPTESLALTLERRPSASPSGFWRGTYTPEQGSAVNVSGLISETGELRLLGEDGTLFSGTTEVVGEFMKATGEAVASAGGTLPDGSSRAPIEFRARLSTSASLVGAQTRAGQTDAFDLGYDSLYEMDLRLTDLAGGWVLSLDNDGHLEIEIGGDGQLVGVDTNGCQYYGGATLIDASYNAFALELEAAGCGAQNGVLRGLAAIEDPVTRQLFFGASSDTQTVAGRFGEKPTPPQLNASAGAATAGTDVSDLFSDVRLSTARVVAEIDGERVVVPLRLEAAAGQPVLTNGQFFTSNLGASSWAADRRFGNSALRVDFAAFATALAAEIDAGSRQSVMLQLYDAQDQVLAETVVERDGRFSVRLVLGEGQQARYGVVAPASGAQITSLNVALTGSALPSIQILTPQDGRRFDVGDTIEFSAVAIDAGGGSIADSIAWTSDTENPEEIGSGGAVSAALQQPGTHTIQATVTEPFGATAADSIRIEVETPPPPPDGSLPNIFLFLSDDVGYGDVGVYNANSQIPTPNIDSLAAAGMRFTDAHAPAAKCAPTRYATITGNYQWRGRRAFGAFHYKGGSQILPGQMTLGQLLQQKGYDTTYIGKVHLGGHFFRKGSNDFASHGDPDSAVDFSRPLQDGPLSYGFDSTYLLLSGIQNSPYAFFRDDAMIGDPNDLIFWDEGRYDGSKINNAGLGMPNWDSREAGPKLVEEAIAFLERHHASNQGRANPEPFFLYFNSQSAHAPFTPPDSMLGVPVAGGSGLGTGHGDMIYEVDVALGLIMQSLTNLGLADDTLIIFTSDNGGNPTSTERSRGHDSSGVLRGKKREIWEGGHRVPFIARWGDGTRSGSTIEPNRVRQQLIGLQDIMATISTIVDQPLPSDQANDSYDFSAVLLGTRGDDDPVRTDMILQGDSGDEVWAFRENNWKLVMDDDFRIAGFFDLDADLTESNDLQNSAQHAQRIANMHAEFLEQRGSNRTAP
ncbi:MAG: arylsulfatase [Pseudomonadota bacterium]